MNIAYNFNYYVEHCTFRTMEETPRNGGPDEGMWTSHYLEGMGYKCIPGSTSRSLGSDSTLMLTGVQIKMNINIPV